MTTGTKLKLLREKRKLSQEELAYKSRCSPNYNRQLGTWQKH